MGEEGISIYGDIFVEVGQETNFGVPVRITPVDPNSLLTYIIYGSNTEVDTDMVEGYLTCADLTFMELGF
jgi:hypothetical protein